MRIDKATLAIKNMDEAVKFYGAILNTEFKATEIEGFTLYGAQLDSLEILLCPRELAEVDPAIGNNTVQIRLVVEDIRVAHQNGLKNGGKEISGVAEKEHFAHASLRDPDGNSIELIEYLR